MSTFKRFNGFRPYASILEINEPSSTFVTREMKALVKMARRKNEHTRNISRQDPHLVYFQREHPGFWQFSTTSIPDNEEHASAKKF